MVDMKRTPSEVAESMPCLANQPEYPYGLCIRLGQDELDKLGITITDIQVNDMVHLHCMGVVTSTSSHESATSGSNSCVEIQITHLEAEDEEEENKEEKPTASQKITKLYK